MIKLIKLTITLLLFNLTFSAAEQSSIVSLSISDDGKYVAAIDNIESNFIILNTNSMALELVPCQADSIPVLACISNDLFLGMTLRNNRYIISLQKFQNGKLGEVVYQNVIKDAFRFTQQFHGYKSLGFGLIDGRAVFVDLENRKTFVFMAVDDGPCSIIGLSPNGKFLVTCGDPSIPERGRIKVWDSSALITGESKKPVLKYFLNGSRKISSISSTALNMLFGLEDGGAGLITYNPETFLAKAEIVGDKEFISFAVVTPDWKYMTIAYKNGSIIRVDLATKESKIVIESSIDLPTIIDTTSDGKIIAVGYASGGIKVFKINS